jgi:hypothetical protein
VIKSGPADVRQPAFCDAEVQMMKTVALFGAVASLGMGSTALAQTVPEAVKKSSDLNKVVCEKVEILGSRLASKKVCMTRYEWAERRQADRHEVEKAQTTQRMNEK